MRHQPSIGRQFRIVLLGQRLGCGFAPAGAPEFAPLASRVIGGMDKSSRRNDLPQIAEHCSERRTRRPPDLFSPLLSFDTREVVSSAIDLGATVFSSQQFDGGE